MLDLAIPASASDALVVLSVEVQRERGAGLPLESETLDGALRCVTRAARSRLGSDGRVYRSERHGLTLLLRGYRGAVADLERGLEDGEILRVGLEADERVGPLLGDGDPERAAALEGDAHREGVGVALAEVVERSQVADP